MTGDRRIEAVLVLAVIAAVLAGCSRPESDSLASAGPTPEDLWQTLDRSGVWVGVQGPPSETGQVAFFEERRGDLWMFPVFSSAARAEVFLSKAAAELSRSSGLTGEAAFRYPVLKVEAAFIAGNDWLPGQLVLDPDTATEHVFTEADHAYFRRMAGGARGSG